MKQTILKGERLFKEKVRFPLKVGRIGIRALINKTTLKKERLLENGGFLLQVGRLIDFHMRLRVSTCSCVYFTFSSGLRGLLHSA